MTQGTYNNYFSKKSLTLLKIKKIIAFSSWLGAVLEQTLTLPPAVREQSRSPFTLHDPAAVLVKWRQVSLHEQGLKGLGQPLDCSSRSSLLLFSPRAVCPSLSPYCTGSLGD